MTYYIKTVTYVIIISSVLTIILNSNKVDLEKLKSYKPEKYFSNENLRLLFDPYPKFIRENKQEKSLARLEYLYDNICHINYQAFVLKKINDIEKESPRHVLTYTIDSITTEHKKIDRNFNPIIRKNCEYYEKMDFTNHLYQVKAKEIVSNQNYIIQTFWYSFQFINFTLIMIFDHIYFLFLFITLIPQAILEVMIDYFQF